ncbi:hypothetical protein BU14_1137s0001 [Porphyra umbilicalis]|uniref:Uncharacterized protein n=1 Tax=Porphyra umbilicalis TaxID=2786 RepID=A0A1X6NMF0_PORUM|nr:hypothetical protein BU14_1137s0001 [Porphyra umbilicalis]|eukprot:OSX69804.1 hypothetical protein BU14_1137s0001 [Porphyra umbilicalis]
MPPAGEASWGIGGGGVGRFPTPDAPATLAAACSPFRRRPRHGVHRRHRSSRRGAGSGHPSSGAPAPTLFSAASARRFRLLGNGVGQRKPSLRRRRVTAARGWPRRSRLRPLQRVRAPPPPPPGNATPLRDAGRHRLLWPFGAAPPPYGAPLAIPPRRRWQRPLHQLSPAAPNPPPGAAAPSLHGARPRPLLWPAGATPRLCGSPAGGRSR